MEVLGILFLKLDEEGEKVYLLHLKQPKIVAVTSLKGSNSIGFSFFLVLTLISHFMELNLKSY